MTLMYLHSLRLTCALTSAAFCRLARRDDDGCLFDSKRWNNRICATETASSSQLWVTMPEVRSMVFDFIPVDQIPVGREFNERAVWMTIVPKVMNAGVNDPIRPRAFCAEPRNRCW